MNMRKLIAVAAVAASSAIPMAANAAWDTTTVYSATTDDGITWRYIMDEDKTQIGLYSTAGKNQGSIIPTSLTGVCYIPATLTHEDGVEYNVTAFPYQPFVGCSISGLVLPETDSFAQKHGTYGSNSGGKQFFDNMKSVVAIWWKGPKTVASGTQPVADLGRTTNTFRSDTSLHVVLLGPNVGYSENGGATYPLFTGLTGVKAFVPKARWTAITDTIFGGTNCKVIRYGAGENIDVSIDGTFTVTTAERVNDVLSVAGDLYTYCGLTPTIKVETPIDETIEIPESAFGKVKFDLHARMTFKVTTQNQLNATFNAITTDDYLFLDTSEATETLTMPAGQPLAVYKVKTQAQLNSVLASFSSSSIIYVDPSGATEKLVVPDGHKVMVFLNAGSSIKTGADGLMIIVK